MNTNGRALELFDAMLNNVFRPGGSVSWRGMPGLEDMDREIGRIRIDVSESDQSYLVKAELPGMRRDDVNVAVNGNRVTISGEYREEKGAGEQEDRVLWSERFVGRFERSFQLPQAIDDNAAQAKYIDGVLELTLPKKEAKGTRRLEIH